MSSEELVETEQHQDILDEKIIVSVFRDDDVTVIIFKKKNNTLLMSSALKCIA